MTSRKFLTVKRSAGPGRQYQQPPPVKKKRSNGVDESTFVSDNKCLHHEQSELNSLYSAVLAGLDFATTPSLPQSTLVTDSSTPSHKSTNHHSSSGQLWSPLPQPNLSHLTRQCLLLQHDGYQTIGEKSSIVNQQPNNSRQNCSKSSQPIPECLPLPISTSSSSSSSSTTTTTTTNTATGQASKSPPTDIVDLSLSEEDDDIELDKLCMEVDLTEFENEAKSPQSKIQEPSTETNCRPQTTASSVVPSRTNRTKLSSFISGVQTCADGTCTASTVAPRSSANNHHPVPAAKSINKGKISHREEVELLTCSVCQRSFPPGTTKQQYTAHLEKCIPLDDVIFID